MGYAKIIGGGPNGRYTIELDYGVAKKAAMLAALAELLGMIDTAIATQLVLIAAADAKEAAQLIKVQAAQQQLIEETAGGLPPGSPRPDTALFKFEQAQLVKLKAKTVPLRLKLETLYFDRANTLRKAAQWNSLNPIETRDAWCADMTDDAPLTSYAATLEIPGESALILLAPGCRPWNAADGILHARETLSPAQAYFNAAILPGWQKFKPTYRWGTCTAIDVDADTMSVSLAHAVSSAQSLGVNQASSLTNVPVVYMECNAEVFEVGDRVVVQFMGQNWSNPRVIGFLDNPVACINWPEVKMRMNFRINTTSPAGYRPWFQSIQSDGACGTQYNIYVENNPTSGAGYIDIQFDTSTLQFTSSYPGATISVISVPDIILGDFTLGGPGPIGSVGQTVPYGDSPGVNIDFSYESIGFFEETTFVRKFFAFEERTEHQYAEIDGVPCIPTGEHTAMHYSNSPTVPTPPSATVFPFTNIQSGQETIYGPGRIHQILPAYPVISVTISGSTREYRVVSSARVPSLSGSWDLFFEKKPSNLP